MATQLHIRCILSKSSQEDENSASPFFNIAESIVSLKLGGTISTCRRQMTAHLMLQNGSQLGRLQIETIVMESRICNELIQSRFSKNIYADRVVQYGRYECKYIHRKPCHTARMPTMQTVSYNTVTRLNNYNNVASLTFKQYKTASIHLFTNFFNNVYQF